MAKAKTPVNTGLDSVLEGLNKKYGEGSVLGLDERSNGSYDTISSGSIGMDYKVLGVGGYVKGKLYELMGWEGTGKSTLCGEAVANCQRQGGKVAYIDGEQAVDRNYFKALGVNTTKMLIAQPSTGEEGFDVTMALIESGEMDLIIIDSDSSLIPKKVVEGEIGESAIGKKAWLNNNAYPKIKGALVKNNTCVIVVSQYREKIGVMFGDPRTTQGGHALKYYTDVRAEVSKTFVKEGDVFLGNRTKVRTTKNKMSPPYRTTEFDVLYGKGIDKIGEMLELMNEFEIGRKYGQSMTYNGIKYPLIDFKEQLTTNPEFFNEIKEQIMFKILKADLPIEIKPGEELEETEDIPHKNVE